MKKKLKSIKFCFEAWDERMPMCIMSLAEGNEDPEEYLLDSLYESIRSLKLILERGTIERDTELIVEYKTDSPIPLKSTISFNGMYLGFFRYKPDGITFRPPVKLSETETREYLGAVFTNADEGLRKLIVDTMMFLISQL